MGMGPKMFFLGLLPFPISLPQEVHAGFPRLGSVAAVQFGARPLDLFLQQILLVRAQIPSKAARVVLGTAQFHFLPNRLFFPCRSIRFFCFRFSIPRFPSCPHRSVSARMHRLIFSCV
jgi:hypothetical protein